MKLAQDYLRASASGETRGGFNSRLQGESNRECMDGMPHGNRWGERNNGWEMANEMVMGGNIFSEVHTEKGPREFKCMQDGNAWCCVGKGFVNLQESDNYTFGDTRQEAIDSFAASFSA